MAYRLATAATAASVVGGLLTGDGVYRHIWEATTAGVGALAIGATGLAAVTARYARELIKERKRRRRGLDEVAEQRQLLASDLRRREAILTRREETLNRTLGTVQIRLASYAEEIDRCYGTMRTLRQQIESLEREVQEVNDERNELITKELRYAQAAFSSRGQRSLKAAASGGPLALPRSEHQHAPADMPALCADHGADC
ncbi:hypothetical protein ABTZ78_16970 [Streptomyces bauhiniae]|uniref:hypothetical protein n=1 Tax=Streptomyces bauhiniae TaxID=2340725 RepID=UPI003317A112